MLPIACHPWLFPRELVADEHLAGPQSPAAPPSALALGPLAPAPPPEPAARAQDDAFAPVAQIQGLLSAAGAVIRAQTSQAGPAGEAAAVAVSLAPASHFSPAKMLLSKVFKPAMIGKAKLVYCGL